MDDVVAFAQRNGCLQAIYDKLARIQDIARRLQMDTAAADDMQPLRDLLNEIEALHRVAYPDSKVAEKTDG